MKIFLYIIITLCSIQVVVAQQRITGRVTSAQTKEALPGATIKVKDTYRGITTNAEGRFTLQANEGEILVISFLGYKSLEVKVTSATSDLAVELEEDESTLKEVVISTGYQDIPKERATGSFVTVGEAELNRRVSTDIISRLEDIVPGLVFNLKGPGQISIRGQSTLFGNAQPLIVIDNFPFDGDIRNLNPADVESISVLKDAAAASIWGTRAGNGVIVITTKRGAYNRPGKISFSSNVRVGAKPDLFYQPRMSSADFIENEKALFNRGYYKSMENSSAKTPLTPAVELLIAKRDGRLDATAADAQLEDLKRYDVRNDLDRYMYRESVNQQYALSMEGGADAHRYFVSGGYDRNLEELRGNSYNRTSLKASATNAFFKKRLEVSTGVSYVNSRRQLDNEGEAALGLSPGVSVYPYARLADNTGNPLPIIKDYRRTYLDQVAESTELLNWRYTPLEDLNLADNRINETDLRLDAGLKYKIIPGLTVEGLYQYQGNFSSGRNHHSQDSYYSRNLINLFSGNTNGQFTRAIPIGGILDLSDGRSSGHNVRGQISYQRNWQLRHDVTALAGAEMRDLHVESRSSRLYGYDDNLGVSTPVDYTSDFSSFVNPFSTLRIANNEGQQDLTDRYLSYYGNGAYTYNGRYTFSASARLDQSNLFGVRSNQKGVPLWSAGAAWAVSSEPFYKLSWLPYLRMRLTYGYNGNVNKSLSAYTTALYFTGAYRTNLPYAQIVNPPNPELRWERVKMVNAGVDFETRNRVLTGTVEFYHKKGLDLIGDAPYPPSSGITTFRGNTADIKGRGVDISLTSRNLDGNFKWWTSLLLSYAADEVTDYEISSSAGLYVQYGDRFAYPLTGRPLYSVYSYRWAGLNPQSGDPQGYLNDGQLSSDYAKIISSTTPENMVYNGPSRPTVFGAFRNTFSWNGFSLSANISYRMGYYFRRSSVNYFQVLNGRVSHGDYGLRWQKPGDENHTTVPSMPATANSARDNLYLYSQALVEKGDHIRLQDVNLSYQLRKAWLQWLPFSGAEFYLYANNVGMIWKANAQGIDPDYQTGPPPVTLAGGLRLQF